MEVVELSFVALPELRKVCDEETLRQMVQAGMERFVKRGHELGDGIFCCRMILPELSDEDKMVLFMLQGNDDRVAPVVMMLWREAVAQGLLPLLQAMVNEGSYRAGPGALKFRDLLAKSGVAVPEDAVRRMSE